MSFHHLVVAKYTTENLKFIENECNGALSSVHTKREAKFIGQSNDLPWSEHCPIAGSHIWLCVYTHTIKN
jgi:hypothetical protein